MLYRERGYEQMKYVLVFLLGVACGAAALVVMSCIVVGKMADNTSDMEEI